MNRRSYRSHELTAEERSRGGYARAEKLRARRETVERMKLEAMVNAPTPRRRRNRGTSRSNGNVYGIRDPYAPAYPVEEPAAVAGLVTHGLHPDDRPRPFDSGRYSW